MSPVTTSPKIFTFDNLEIPGQGFRQIAIEKPVVDTDGRLELSVSSNIPYERWGYTEELRHTASAVDLSRFKSSANVLYNHNRDKYIGVVEDAYIKEIQGQLIVKMRFAGHDFAQQIKQDVNDGIIKNVSIGYQIQEFIELESKQDYFVASKWGPFEFSFVTVPADYSVGVGRAYYDFAIKASQPPAEKQAIAQKPDIINKIKEETNMSEVTAQAPAINEHDVRTQERERIQGIHALSQRHGHNDLALKAIQDGLSIIDARSLYLDKVALKQAQDPVAAGIKPVDMTNKERERYSAIKAVGYAAGMIKDSKVGLELEVSKDIEQRLGKAPNKIYLDQSQLVSFRAPYETGVPVAAGNLIATELLSDRFIEQLYNESAFLNMGVTYMRDLTGNIEIPREATYTGGHWVGEKNTIPEEEGTFDKIALSPHKLAVITKITFEMMEQASIDLERIFRARLIRGLALELDRTIGFGSGIGNEPLGIASHPETQSIVLGVNGAPLDRGSLIQMQTELASANALREQNSGYVFNSRTRGKLMTTLDHQTGGGTWLYNSRGGNTGEVAGYQARTSNQIPDNLIKGTATDLTAAFFGDFSNVLLALWSGMDLMANPYSEFSEAIIQVRAMQLADINLTRGDYFCVATDVQNN